MTAFLWFLILAFSGEPQPSSELLRVPLRPDAELRTATVTPTAEGVYAVLLEFEQLTRPGVKAALDLAAAELPPAAGVLPIDVELSITQGAVVLLSVRNRPVVRGLVETTSGGLGSGSTLRMGLVVGWCNLDAGRQYVVRYKLGAGTILSAASPTLVIGKSRIGSPIEILAPGR